MAASWRLRTVGSGDAAAIARLWAQAEARRHGLPIPETVPDDVVERQAQRLARPGVVAVMAFVDATPVAACYAEPARWFNGLVTTTAAHLSGVSVHPDWWGRGIAEAMLDFVLAELHDAGFEHVQLWVLETNSRARGLYERTGWQLARLGAFHRDGPHAVYTRDTALSRGSTGPRPPESPLR